MTRKALLTLGVDKTKEAPLQAQLCHGLKVLIQGRSLRPGEAIPSSRELAGELAVSRNTVIAACDRLVGEGYLEARPRSGLFVSESLAQVAPAITKRTRVASRSRLPAVRIPGPFRPCQPDVRLFPLALWNRMRARCLRTYGGKLLHYQSGLALGLPALQQSLAAYLSDSRGVHCDWRQAVVTAGSQQAIYMLAHLLLKPGDGVMMEDPGFARARLTFTSAGALVQSLSVDENGVIPPVSGAPVLIYVTPSRQFPTGACLPVARRLALIEYAAKVNAWIVEDDYDSEFRYTRPPLPSLQSLDPTGRVIYVGTMSKILFPSLRIGYTVLPDRLMERFAALRGILDDHGPLIDQATLAEFIDTGAFYTHIGRCRREYGSRMGAFLTAAEKERMPLRFPHTDGGMNVTGFWDEGVADGDCTRVLAEAGLEVPALSAYSVEAKQRGLVFGFTAFGEAAIRTAVGQAARVLRPMIAGR